MMPLQIYIDDIIKTALLEDINYIDTATDLLIDENQTSNGYFKAKADGILCGIDVAMRVFTMLDGSFSAEKCFRDGDKIKKGDIICRFSGNTRCLLKGERTALNLIQHMSGIASQTSVLAELCKGTKASIADTRKTLPGIRALQKYSVVTGGGSNHRFNLSSGAMIKDNHIDASGSITKALNSVREKGGHMLQIEVETRTLDEVQEALDAGADIIMLDNMDHETMRKAVGLVDGRAVLEASGGITGETVREVAQTGVDIISSGAITHSVHAFDISMIILSGEK